MDWVPCVQYASPITVPPASTVYVVLYPLPDYQGTDEEFLVEDDAEWSLFIERIVGHVVAGWSQTAAGRVEWSLLPLGVDYQLLTVQEPFASDWEADQSEWANVRFWDKRVYTLDSTEPFPALFEHPYWTQVDIHPRQRVGTLDGAGNGLWPVLAVRNNHMTVDLEVSHQLRMLIK